MKSIAIPALYSTPLHHPVPILLGQKRYNRGATEGTSRLNECFYPFCMCPFVHRRPPCTAAPSLSLHVMECRLRSSRSDRWRRSTRAWRTPRRTRRRTRMCRSPARTEACRRRHDRAAARRCDRIDPPGQPPPRQPMHDRPSLGLAGSRAWPRSQTHGPGATIGRARCEHQFLPLPNCLRVVVVVVTPCASSVAYCFPPPPFFLFSF